MHWYYNLYVNKYLTFFPNLVLFWYSSHKNKKNALIKDIFRKPGRVSTCFIIIYSSGFTKISTPSTPFPWWISIQNSRTNINTVNDFISANFPTSWTNWANWIFPHHHFAGIFYSSVIIFITSILLFLAYFNFLESNTLTWFTHLSDSLLLTFFNNQVDKSGSRHNCILYLVCPTNIYFWTYKQIQIYSHFSSFPVTYQKI